MQLSNEVWQQVIRDLGDNVVDVGVAAVFGEDDVVDWMRDVVVAIAGEMTRRSGGENDGDDPEEDLTMFIFVGKNISLRREILVPKL